MKFALLFITVTCISYAKGRNECVSRVDERGNTHQWSRQMDYFNHAMQAQPDQRNVRRMTCLAEKQSGARSSNEAVCKHPRTNRCRYYQLKRIDYDAEGRETSRTTYDMEENFYLNHGPADNRMIEVNTNHRNYDQEVNNYRNNYWDRLEAVGGRADDNTRFYDLATMGRALKSAFPRGVNGNNIEAETTPRRATFTILWAYRQTRAGVGRYANQVNMRVRFGVRRGRVNHATFF